MKFLLLILSIAALAGCKSTKNLETVSGFNPEKYMGTWYEIARYPHRFEKGMSNVSATYSLNDDGTIKVRNNGYMDAENKWKDIEGVAKQKKAGKGWLKVSFFKPFYASYKIISLNDEYTEAVVTGPSYKYLWILARDKNLADENREKLIQFISKKGFDTDPLIIVEHNRTP